MNVYLTPELQLLVANKVKTGQYGSAGEVVAEALRLMDARDLAKAEIREKIAAGIASAKAGRLSDGEAFFAELAARLDAAGRSEEYVHKRPQTTRR